MDKVFRTNHLEIELNYGLVNQKCCKFDVIADDSMFFHEKRYFEYMFVQLLGGGATFKFYKVDTDFFIKDYSPIDNHFIEAAVIGRFESYEDNL